VVEYRKSEKIPRGKLEEQIGSYYTWPKFPHSIDETEAM